MGYTTFGTLLTWLQEPAGKTVNDNRSDLVTLANDIRQHFYLLYEKVQMFMDVRECFCVQRFQEHCDPCDKWTFGITLPSYIQTPEQIRVSGVPVTLFNKWREWNVGFTPNSGCRVESNDLGDGFCTELDIGRCPSRLKILAMTSRDCGKIVRITYFDTNGVKVTDQIRLGLDYIPTSAEAVRFHQPGGVIFSQPLEGGVVIAQDNEKSRVLSEYYPAETIPSMRRLKLTNVCEGDVIEIKGARRFTPMFYDHDVVETDNKQAFVEMALAFKFSRSPTTDQTVLATGTWHENRAKQYLIGEKARDEGGATVKRIQLLGKHINRSRLPTRRFRNWPR